MRIRQAVSALAVLLPLLAISACKKQQQPQQRPQQLQQRVTTLELRNLTPIPVVYEGQLLKWEPESQSASVTVTIPAGLCDGLSGNVTATHDQPAQCTIARQDMGDNESKTYTYTLSSAGATSDPDVLVKRCIGCP
jgi:hypothetical protein